MATKQSDEQEIQFKKRARRRLVGAIALVLLMVTLLPIVLDNHEDQTPVPEIAISIPSQDDSDFTSKVVPVQPATPPTTAGTEPAPPRETTEPTATPAMPDPEAAAGDPRAGTEPEQGAGAAAKDSYMVQIGLFSDAARVKQLQARIAELGIETSTLKDGEKIRLRAGPYASREDAARVADKLKAAGHQTMLVRNK